MAMAAASWVAAGRYGKEQLWSAPKKSVRIESYVRDRIRHFLNAQFKIVVTTFHEKDYIDSKDTQNDVKYVAQSSRQ